MREEHVDVLLIGGRSGVGKSTVGWEVCVQLEAADVAHCYIEGDFLGQVFPAPAGDPDRAKIAEDNLTAIWRNFSARGYRRLVFTNTVSVIYAEDIVRALDAPTSVVRVLLTASDEATNRRLAGREIGSQLDPHIARSARMALRLEEVAPPSVIRVSTDGRGVIDIAKEVVAATGWVD
jgi:hypothetical protein